MNKITTISFSALLATFSYAAYAGSPSEHYVDYAKVLRSEPIYSVERTPVEDQECWDETVTYRRPHSGSTAMIAGGIIGGVIGNQFGKGHGKDAATVAGTLLGGSIGRDIGHNGYREHHQTEQRCRVTRRYVEREHVSGYRVTYRYDGRTFTRTMSYDPGHKIRVRVNVVPVY